MNLSRSRSIAVIIILIVLVLVVIRLKGNKEKFREDIAFAQRKVDKIPVATARASKGVLSERVVSTGTLEASDVLNLLSETQGKILKIYKDKGDYVSAGDVIAKVDDEVISATTLTAEANYEQFEKDVDRLTRLSAENAIAKHDLEQASIGLKKAKADLINARKALSNTSIKAPISGIINNRYITVGQLLGPGSPVCEIVNNSKLKLNIKVSEDEVYKLRKGQEVEIRLTVFPDKKFTGTISAIAEKADLAMKFNIELTLSNNSDIPLKSGLYAEALLPVQNAEKLLIPKGSIIGSMEEPVVYTVNNGKAFKREIITGQSNDKQIEVLKGLSDGDQIVVSGQLNLKDGDDVNVIK